ncbi:cobalt transporter [Rheinheimera sp. D18]|uniref:cobalt transporter n=1 Tax=Rheinheimera sp. D18 TaxID=2545632 RepID=UPI00104C98B0|nr:cobalt transporter [Rheinheimera sp. D18]QBL09537.1 cobalt transporter [Rheinheimera sp. D18]
MLRKTIGLVILLIIMLNHAVVACDAMIIHMPDHAHAYASLTDTHLNQVHNNDHSSKDDADQHSAHAHVSCHIAFFNGVELLNFNSSAISCANLSCQTISYSPPVPPPNV